MERKKESGGVWWKKMKGSEVCSGQMWGYFNTSVLALKPLTADVSATDRYSATLCWESQDPVDTESFVFAPQRISPNPHCAIQATRQERARCHTTKTAQNQRRDGDKETVTRLPGLKSLEFSIWWWDNPRNWNSFTFVLEVLLHLKQCLRLLPGVVHTV